MARLLPIAVKICGARRLLGCIPVTALAVGCDLIGVFATVRGSFGRHGFGCDGLRSAAT